MDESAVLSWSGKEKKMNKIFLVAFVMLLSVSFVALSSYAKGIKSSAGKGGFLTFDSSDLIGAPVKNSHGQFLGLISEVLIDNMGHAEFAVINHGSYEKYGSSGRFTPVPIAALKISETRSGQFKVVLNSSEAKLEAAPFLDPTKTDNPQYEADIYRYYGIQPSWTEEGEPMK